MTSRPGIMLYFEIRDALRFLTLEEKGQLLDAVLEYGMFGTVPEFAGILGMAWAFVKPKLDVDAERYDNEHQRIGDQSPGAAPASTAD